MHDLQLMGCPDASGVITCYREPIAGVLQWRSCRCAGPHAMLAPAGPPSLMLTRSTCTIAVGVADLWMPCRGLQLAPTSSLCTTALLSAPMASFTASSTMAPLWLLTSGNPGLQRCVCVFDAVCCHHTVKQHLCAWHIAGCQAVRTNCWEKVCRLTPYYMAALDGSTPGASLCHCCNHRWQHTSLCHRCNHP